MHPYSYSARGGPSVIKTQRKGRQAIERAERPIMFCVGFGEVLP